MDPASDRSYIPPSDATLRSTFQRHSSPAGQRSRSRGRGHSHAETKSTTMTTSSSSSMSVSSRRSSAPTIINRGRETKEQKSLESYISTTNSRAASNNRTPQHELLDLHSLDKQHDGAATWASRDWCAEARKSRGFLRDANTTTTAIDEGNNGRENIGRGESLERQREEENRRRMRNSITKRSSMEGLRAATAAARQGSFTTTTTANGNTTIQGGANTMPESPTDDFSCLWNNAAETAAQGDALDIRSCAPPKGSGRHLFHGEANTTVSQYTTEGNASRHSGEHHGEGSGRREGGYEQSNSLGNRRAASSSGDNRYETRGSNGSSSGSRLTPPGHANHYEQRRKSLEEEGLRSRGRPHPQQQQQQRNGEFDNGIRQMEEKSQNNQTNSSSGRSRAGGYNNDNDDDDDVQSQARSTIRRLDSPSLAPTRMNDDDATFSQHERSRGRRPGSSMDDPLARSKSRGSERQYERSQSRGARSQSRGPSGGDRHHQRGQMRSSTPGPSHGENGRPSRSQTPAPSEGDTEQQPHHHRSRSKSIHRPQKKLGCLGGSSDMTYRRSSSSGGGEPLSHDERRANMKSFEKEMRSQRKQSQTEKMTLGNNNNRLQQRGSDGDLTSSRRDGHHEGNSRSVSRGGGGRSVSRGGEGRGGRSHSRGAHSRHGGGEEEDGTRGRSRQTPRDPSCSRSSAGRSKSRRSSTPANHTIKARSSSRAKSSSSRAKSSSRSRQSPSRTSGRNSAPTSTRASPDDHRIIDTTRRLASKLKSKSPGRRKNTMDATVDTSRSSKRTSKSAHSSSSSATPETGPLSSVSGKSSGRSLLRNVSRGKLSMPPSTPPPGLDDSSSYHGSSRPATPNRIPDPDESTIGTSATPSGHSGTTNNDEEEIMTYMFDRKGYCIRHPAIRLRKKKMLGGWQVIHSNCPECCVEEMDRLKRVRKRMKKKKKKNKKGDKKMKKDGNKTVKGVPDLDGDEDRRRGRERSRSRVRAAGRSRSRSKARSVKSTRTASKSQSRHRSKSRDRRRGSSSVKKNDTPVFEFDIPLDDRGEVKASSGGGRSVRSRKSASSKKSSRSARTNKSGKSTRTSKSTRTTKTSKSRSHHQDGGSSSRRRKSRSRGDSKGRKKNGGEAVVSRGAAPGSSQRFIRQGCNLRVAKMPFTDKYNREGKYTGEINEFGQPHGQGTLRYNNGNVYEGLWIEGHSEDMDANMSRAKEPFSGNWKNNTKEAKKDRERRKEEEMNDLRSFISQSVRSGSVHSGGGGSQLYHQSNANQQQQRRKSPKQRHQEPQVGSNGQVHNMPWEDVNGFAGQYSGEVNSNNVPDGHGYMQYSNGVVEEGYFCNGVYQPPSGDPVAHHEGNHGNMGEGMGGNAGAIPSSSMSVWSLKSSPTMAFNQGGHNVLTGAHPGNPNGGASVMGAPTSVHLGAPSGMYGNAGRRY